MAIGGSFSFDSGLHRFLARCPNLGTLPQFQSLANKTGDVMAEELVGLLAELFVHPKYTIPLIGCFCPVVQNIVNRTVASLKLVPNLASNLGDTGNFDDVEIVNVIDFYAGRGRGLDLHEFACLAFCRALDLVPSLLRAVLAYFEFAPPPFKIILNGGTYSELFTQVANFLQAARISYRLLITEPIVFSKLWDWSCFLDLVNKASNINSGDVASGNEDVVDLRWCAIQILAVVLNMSDKAIADFGMEAENSLSSFLRWKEFCLDVSMEKAGLYIGSSKSTELSDIDFNHENFLQSFGRDCTVLSLSGGLEPSSRRRRIAASNHYSSSNRFVLTSNVKKSMEMVQLAVSQKWPVLLYGPPGSGKSALISKLAHDTGNQVLNIHMDGQIDGKTLVGSYVCTEQPGEFKWQPGSFTQAVMNGFWVVFEDIEKAPQDVHSILLPLLEGASSFVTGHGEEIKVAESFQLFSTISTSKLDASCGIEGGNLIGTLWRRVMTPPASNEDMKEIVKSWYPSLEPLAGKFIETFKRVNYGPHQHAGFQSGDPVQFTSLCRFSLRDLLKWCKRVAGLGLSSVGDGLSAHECQCIYQEAVDIFASFSPSSENRLIMMKEIAKLWAIPLSLTESLYPPNKPVIQDMPLESIFGRVALVRAQTLLNHQRRPFVEIRSSLTVLEKIACSVKHNEPVLLVGETGTGKTTLVQNLATRLGQRLTVLNMSQQSDVVDLLGGFKPMDAQFICIPLYKEFEDLFANSFSVKGNIDFISRLQRHLSDKNWKMLLSGLQKGVDFFRSAVGGGKAVSSNKRKKPFDEGKIKMWENLAGKLENARRQIGASSGLIFTFVEGAFVSALRNGEWILLDEVNLAPPETTHRLIGVLEGENGSLCLAERGDASYIQRHPNFRIFACMNPATDAGKRDLPYSLRSRFTEYFVDDVMNDEDLNLFIKKFMGDMPAIIDIAKVVHFYKIAKKESEERLQDGANQKPQYSLRSLYRALEYTKKAAPQFGFQRAIYDGFCMFFLNLLEKTSAKVMKQMILSCMLGGKSPPYVPFDRYLEIGENSGSDEFLENYVLTKSVKEHLSNLARAIFIKRYPVLLQGPTSSGKTSMVQYLAAVTGHEFVRINNHEHTDLQEYLGSYITDASGKLVFQEGVLVKAVRNGFWIVLDELNLAPSDVLEALNRLLDDNRELFMPELRETVRAHPSFMLFATQNPPTFYGGRKMLSRAFRNRFVEIHVDEIPEDELSTILERRCQIPASYAKKMVEIMVELQLLRQSSKIFAGKHGFITPRDLFRWAGRFRAFGKSYEDLARDGYYLLAERLRDEGEKFIVQEVLERHLRVKILKDDLYKEETVAGNVRNLPSLGSVVWTKSMLRLYFLVERCYKLREPVLLVGETGAGKTTVCQLLSSIMGSKLHILNCHQYTETSDFLGGFFPIRDRSVLMSEFKDIIEQLVLSKAFIHFPADLVISSDIGLATATLDQLAVILKGYRQGLVSHPEVCVYDVDTFEKMQLDLAQLHQRWQMIFMWQDGPLLQAMKGGDLFLVDEISLADDSVLERLNSVLEPERKLALAEKGGPVLEKVTAHTNFFLLATMNPGGDYGKKELSPALRNRFTEIWVPPVSDLDELRSIGSRRLNPELSRTVVPMINFWTWFNQLQTGRTLTVRDILGWVDFINVSDGRLEPDFAFLHGAFLVLLDGLSLGTNMSKQDASEMRERCLSFLLEQLRVESTNFIYSTLSNMDNYGWGDVGKAASISCTDNMQCENFFGIDPFFIEKGSDYCEVGGFEFMAPTTCRNSLRVLRAMQLPKPVLLEGSPGVGKTSLIVALGKFSGHKVVRINLSEQTDMMDLLGSDLPVESDGGMKFAWSDGILLQALKEGCWVLLDELNLAPQSVLEGLNAILDHRAEVFIPELGRTFKCPPSFRVFACQNPSCQGGGRKGLPKSFLNRFTKVYVDELVEADYLFICSSLYPSIPRHVLSKLILFNKRLHEDTMLHHKFAQDGSPWEFNLRDVIRSCQMMQSAPEKSVMDCFLNVVYVQRMRTAADRKEVLCIYEQVFGTKSHINPFPRVQLNSQYLIVGNTAVKRNYFLSSKNFSSQLKILPSVRHSLEVVANCVRHQWLCIMIGPSSSGKTSLIRLLADLTGNILNELNLSSATDISDLLGCFEQYNSFQNFRSVVSQVECYINEYFRLQLEAPMKTFVSERKFMGWRTSLSNLDHGSILGSLDLLVEIIEELKSCLEKNDLPVSWSFKELGKIMRIISKLKFDQQNKTFSAKFEWVMGLLIKAIENGEWIVLKNANSCNPTVLDRINSLVEQCGSITVNECGIVDGKPVVLHPHPNFRLFLTVNPSYGEVSRAMRNRGVEVFMMEPYWLLDEGSDYSYEEIGLKDVQRFLVLSGIPDCKFIQSMAKAHFYARKEGYRLNVNITYLELARWVHLFKQLVVNGNQSLWSLHISWEHIYLSSLGEAAGNYIIRHAKISYLSSEELVEQDSSFTSCLCLPGGWPMPLMLRDFIWFSQEASIKQNCMYLEFLGANIASYEFRTSCNNSRSNQDLVASCFARPYLMDTNLLHLFLFPTDSNGIVSNSCRKTEFNLELANKMLLFAANWIIEQSTERDLNLYILWFSWFSYQLEPFCQFFKNFLHSFKQELEHPIWKCVRRFRHELELLHEIDHNIYQLPMLSLQFVDFIPSSDSSRLYCKLLCNAINCVGLLRLTYQQWNAQSMHVDRVEVRGVMGMLNSLRALEEEILNMLVDSSSFDLLSQLYANLIEDHILFWNGVTSSQSDHSLISLRSLAKDIAKFQDIFPRVVKLVHMEISNLGTVSSWRFYSEKSLLWVFGGHPCLPSSASLYNKEQQLLKLCDSVWPTNRVSCHQEENASDIDIAARASPELRILAVEGLCMSSYFIGRCEEEEVVLQQLEEMNQMLLERFEFEKKKLESHVRHIKDFVLVENTTCCILPSEVLCLKSVFDNWLDTLPINDATSFFLDMKLLKELSSIILVDGKGLELALGCISNLMEYALKFSLTLSSRPPQTFLPHQKILWTVGAWTSVDAVDMKIATFILEMWFRWHQSLWTHFPDCVKNFFKICDDAIPETDMLVQPVITASVNEIMYHTYVSKDYWVHRTKLKVVSCNLWRSSTLEMELPIYLLGVARSLFKQIIYAHKKSFDAEDFMEIKSVLCSWEKSPITQDDVQIVSSLISSSSHKKLKSLVDSFIEPLLKELFFNSLSSDNFYKIGSAWLHVGALRLYLLLSDGDLDPAVKYACKYSQLVDKISLLELETKVRQECDYLAGCNLAHDSDEKSGLLKDLEFERKRLRRKVIFRPEPTQYKKLKDVVSIDCKILVEKIMVLVKNIDRMDSQAIEGEVQALQASATGFIGRLSDEYTALIDIVQPVQVAVYEMKLGLSLILLSARQNIFMERVEEDNMHRVMGTIYSFMRFPRDYGFKSMFDDLDKEVPFISSTYTDLQTDFFELDITFLEKLLDITSDASADTRVPVLQHKAALHVNILLRVSQFVSNSLVIDKSSFMLFDMIFNKFVSSWIEMKVDAKTKEDYDAQQYKFRPLAFEIKSFLDVDVSALGNLLSNDSFSEWQELLSDEESTEKNAIEKAENLEEEWSLVEENLINNMVHIHNQLFGSIDLFLTPGISEISDTDKLLSFMESYSLGVHMIKGLRGLYSSGLDAKLVPEHLLSVCLEHDMFGSSHKPLSEYNFYKDSNAPALAKMVKLLTSLQQRILSLLSERENHPGLQKILDVIEMLLSIPLKTPLAKALSGMQFLFNRVRLLQENGSKFPLAGELEPIISLASSWQKMEFDSWPALLDEVQLQYETNAGKLWFPLYSVLQHRRSADITGHIQTTIQSLEEFFQTSSIGEFKKRLQLLLAFYGQITTGNCLESNSSPCQIENEKMLYNIFGFYVQFLPIVMEHMEAKRKSIELELKDVLKLCRWERYDSNSALDNSKKIKKKLRKLIQKYTDILQQPVMLILNQESAQKGMKMQSLQFPRLINVFLDRSLGKWSAALDLVQFNYEERFMWCAGWNEKVICSLQNLDLGTMQEFGDSKAIVADTVSIKMQVNLYEEEWKVMWYTLETIFRTTISCASMWDGVNKSLGKRRALSDLLKLLEHCGLSRHKSTTMEDSSPSSLWFLQPSYDIQHLLLTQGRLSYAAADVTDLSNNQRSPDGILCNEWKTANEFYFKSMVSVLLLQQISLKFHKDFTIEQVNRSSSFLHHLIVIAQKQRAVAYRFSGQLKTLRDCASSLESLCPSSPVMDIGTGSGCSVAEKPSATLKCMWQQKQLFDSLCAMLDEESLLLRTVEGTHFDTCQSLKAKATEARSFIEKFITIFKESKEALNKYLLGNNGSTIIVAGSFHPCFISKQMELLVLQNFHVVEEFERSLSAFEEKNPDRSSVEQALLSRFSGILKENKLMGEQFRLVTQERTDAGNDTNSSNELKDEFSGALKGTYEHIVDAFQKLSSLSNSHSSLDESLGNITFCDTLFESYVENLSLNKLFHKLLKTVEYAAKLLSCASIEVPNLSCQIGKQFKHLHMLLDLVLNFADCLLKDFLATHRTVTIMTHVLANVFASLYSKGFGISAEDPQDESVQDRDASGTGMGEGAGLNDVSDQITDEDQLLGASSKKGEEEDTSNEVPSKTDKGIEMEEDFAGDTFSVSEDEGEGEDGDEDEEEQLDSTMGENGPDSEVVDEKMWNKDENKNLNDSDEKYESGPSVKDQDTSSRELRAKEDNATTAEESGNVSDEPVDPNDETGNNDDLSDADNMEDINVSKEEAFTDPTGVNPDDVNRSSEEDMNMDEEGAVPEEGECAEEHDEAAEDENHQEDDVNLTDETMQDADIENMDGSPENNDPCPGDENADTNSMAPKKDAYEEGISTFPDDQVPNAESASQPNKAPAGDSRKEAPETNWSNGNDINNDQTPMALPSNNTSDMDVMVAEPSYGGRLADEQLKSQLPQPESSSLQKAKPNPYRNVGDALQEWKERVKVTVDLHTEDTEMQGEMEDENGDEYGYVSEFEKGTAQTLGPATSDQVEKNVENYKPDGDSHPAEGDDLAKTEIEMQDSEQHHVGSSDLILKNQTKELMHTGTEKVSEQDSTENHSRDDDGDGRLSESVVSVKKSYLSGDLHQLSQLSISDNEQGKAHKLYNVSSDMKTNASALWRRYELQTTRLSQELAEQLRLVMEPTLASKLQGDYKTGKRINMKKVIPYIASHYRRDKIWLRRTRPNKRDYQVVIAVDDSRSMSESCCGDVAIEALVTVCRAMSQLEMGNLAVASFGGNIKLLHGFDEPFTGETGIKMISGLTFKQENTIADEPVVDLLKYLNTFLDAAVVNARLPSGQNPLEQLVLIIGDGRFHEKVKLKQCVRDALSRKRMVAFLLLDSPEESIMDLQEILPFEGTDVKIAKYLDSFPFPYYIVLKNMEALPRTLADLLRQWFEIMQYSRD